MKLLWIPHGTWQRKIRQRDQYFIDILKKNHEIHILTWTEPEGPGARHFLNPYPHIKALKNWKIKEDNLQIHHLGRLCLSTSRQIRRINEFYFQKRIKEIVDKNDIDTVICGPNYYLNGFPPFDLEVPLIFDYSDYIADMDVKKVYLEKSDAVLCVSNVLLEEAKKINPNSYYLPNGVDTEKFKNGDGGKIRNRLNLENAKIVSLIGLTCSESLYFIDALPLIKKQVPNVKYLIVGENYLRQKMEEKVRKKYEEDVIFTRWVPYEEIHNYFLVSDVGIYPVDKNIYFDSACPIKVLEFSAAKKPVVSTPIKELEYWNFPNIMTAEPTVEDFSIGVVKALTSKFKFPNLQKFDIEYLAKKLEKILKKI